jgi:hypothetical protein
MSLFNTPPVQSNAQVQALIHAHIMQHIQMKADRVAVEQMPPEVKAQYDQINQQINMVPPEQRQQLQQQGQDLLAQFSAPVLAELVNEYTQKIGAPQDEDPLVTIRKQELALKGQELAQEQQQFVADQQRKEDDARRQDQIDRERIQAQEDIAAMRDDTARERLEQQKQLKIQDLLNKYSN